MRWPPRADHSFQDFRSERTSRRRFASLLPMSFSALPS
jgi:hypothetical protein